MEPGFDLVFNVIFSAFKVEKWLKVSVKTKMEAEHKVTNKHFKLKYFLRTCSPRHLGIKQEIAFATKVIQNKG